MKGTFTEAPIIWFLSTVVIRAPTLSRRKPLSGTLRAYHLKTVCRSLIRGCMPPSVEKKSKYILAIDLGTSGAKSALVSVRGEIAGCEFEKTPLHLIPGGGAEQNPDDWWNAILSASKRVLARQLVPSEEVVALSCTTQWSGTVPVDRGGNSLANAIIWMDSRGSREVEEITGGPIRIAGYGILKLGRWIRLTGGIPARSGKDSIAHILYIKHEHPEVYNRAFKFLEPKDYINLRFTGRFMSSYDTITLHWVTNNRDVTRIDYDNRLLRLTRIDRDKLPDLGQAVDILGTLRKEIARELGLRKTVKVVIGAPDMHTAALGSGAVRDGEAHLYIGSSSWLTCHLPYKKTDLFHNIASLPSAIPGRYFLTNEQETAGACLRFFKERILFHNDGLAGNFLLFEGSESLAEDKPQTLDLPLNDEAIQERKQKCTTTDEEIYSRFERIIENVPAGSEGVIFTPWLYGERTPVDNHLIRAGFFNLSLRHTRAHLLRAVYEGVAYNTRWLMGHVERFMRKRLHPLNMIGGGAVSEVWCQIHADVCDRIVQQVEDPLRANVRGAAFIAAVALGYINFEDIPRCVRIRKVFEPNQRNRGIYDLLFREYLNIYKKNRKIYERLNSRGFAPFSGGLV